VEEKMTALFGIFLGVRFFYSYSNPRQFRSC
jgi:hypothetical protein